MNAAVTALVSQDFGTAAALRFGVSGGKSQRQLDARSAGGYCWDTGLYDWMMKARAGAPVPPTYVDTAASIRSSVVDLFAYSAFFHSLLISDRQSSGSRWRWRRLWRRWCWATLSREEVAVMVGSRKARWRATRIMDSDGAR